MTPQTGSHPGNALSPHDILRREVLRHARAAYRHTKEDVPADETPEHLKLAAAQAPADQEDDDQDKAALWLRSGTDAAATADEAAKAGVMFTDGQAAGAASAVTQGTAASAGAAAGAGAAVGSASAAGATAAAGSALLGPSILGAFAAAAGANLQDSVPLHNLSARNRLPIGHDSTREDVNAGTEGQSSAAASAESATPSAPAAPDASTADASKPAEGSDGNALPQVKPLPAYSENASVSYAHGENKALGATVFSGSNDETAPAFVRITAIQGKDGEAAAGTMSLLGGNAIVPNQVIARADFDKVVWDASKNEGGSFKFIPVQDAQGTALPGAVEQTVTIHEAPALPTYQADMSVAYTYNQNKAVGADIFNGTDSATAPAFVRITAIQGKDGDAAANTMSLKDGEALTAGSVVARADFDKVVWDASKNEGGSFKFIPVQDAQGTALPGAVEQTVNINEARPFFHIAAEKFDLLAAYPHLVDENPAYLKVIKIVEASDTNGILDALVLGEDGGTVLKEGDIIRAEDFGRVYWNHASNDGGGNLLRHLQRRRTSDRSGTVLDGAGTFLENPGQEITAPPSPRAGGRRRVTRACGYGAPGHGRPDAAGGSGAVRGHDAPFHEQHRPAGQPAGTAPGHHRPALNTAGRTRHQTGSSLATASASHLTPCGALKRIWMRASSPLPSMPVTTPSPKRA